MKRKPSQYCPPHLHVISSLRRLDTNKRTIVANLKTRFVLFDRCDFCHMEAENHVVVEENAYSIYKRNKKKGDMKTNRTLLFDSSLMSETVNRTNDVNCLFRNQ